MYICLVFFQLNSIITCYVCVQLIKFIYIFICICFVSNSFIKSKVHTYFMVFNCIIYNNSFIARDNYIKYEIAENQILNLDLYKMKIQLKDYVRI